MMKTTTMIMNEVMTVMLSTLTTDEYDICFGEDDVMTMITVLMVMTTTTMMIFMLSLFLSEEGLWNWNRLLPIATVVAVAILFMVALVCIYVCAK